MHKVIFNAQCTMPVILNKNQSLIFGMVSICRVGFSTNFSFQSFQFFFYFLLILCFMFTLSTVHGAVSTKPQVPNIENQTNCSHSFIKISYLMLVKTPKAHTIHNQPLHFSFVLLVRIPFVASVGGGVL